jgi:hypothetical protein
MIVGPTLNPGGTPSDSATVSGREPLALALLQR